jgi:hypothetical protein
MNNVLILISCLFLFSNAKCKKDKKCHPEILIINKSNQEIIPALKAFDVNNNCVLSGTAIKPNETYKRPTNGCWEDQLINEITFDLYIIDPVKFNATNVFYSSDSIEIKNKVLKHYVFSLDDLNNRNFILVYE